MRGTLWSVGVLALLFSASPAGGKPDGDRPHSATKSQTGSWAVLREALKSADYSVRITAAQALGDVRAVDTTSWLSRCLADPEHDVRVAAVDSLRRIGSPRAIELLRSVRDDKKEALDVRALAASALLNLTGE